MTGLYECLVQIRALRETAQRLVDLVSSGTDSEPAIAGLARRREQLELTHGEWLARLLGTGVPAPAEVAPDANDFAAAALARFLAAREANLALLERLGASELEQTGVLPDGRPAAVTDVVAMMVAADTDAVAALRAATQTSTNDPKGGP